jgi:hypothetical protein
LVLRWSLVSSLRLRRPRKLSDRALPRNGFIALDVIPQLLLQSKYRAIAIYRETQCFCTF